MDKVDKIPTILSLLKQALILEAEQEETVNIRYIEDLHAVVASVGGKRVGALRVKPFKEGYKVDAVSVNPDYRKLGIGTEMYRVAFEALHSLHSDMHQTPDAKRIWNSLINSGEAKRVGDRFRMIKAESSLDEGIDDPVQPGILKDRLGKLSCTKVKAAKAELKDKGTHYAKALQRYINYHCK